MSSDRWCLKRVKDIARLNYGSELSDNVSGNIPVYGSGGIFKYTHTPNTSSPVLVIGRKGLVGSLHYLYESCYCIDTVFFIDKTNTDESIKWLYYCFHLLDLSLKLIGSGPPGISRESVYSKYLLIPLLSKQQAIANFLDAKTSSINNYLKSKSLELNNLVDSKTHLYNSISNYKATRLKYVATVISGKSLSNKPVINNPQQVNVVSFKHVLDDNIVISGLQSGNVSSAFLIKNKLEYNDVLITGEGDYHLLGRSGLFKDEANNYVAGAGVYVIRVNQDLVDPEFLSIYIRAAECKDYFSTHNLAAHYPPRISLTDLKNLPVPLIPLSDQKQITTSIKNKISKIDSCISSVQSQIKLMDAYRKSLIFEAVTGKLYI